MMLNCFRYSADEKITQIVNKFKGFLAFLMFMAAVTYFASPFLATVLVASP